MFFTKLKIIIIALSLIVVILGNFWYYTYKLGDNNSRMHTGENLVVLPQKIETNQKTADPSSNAESQPHTTQAATVSDALPNVGDTIPSQTAISPIVNKKNSVKTPPNASIVPTSRPTMIDSAPGESPKTEDTTNYATLGKILIDKSWKGNGNNSNYSHYWGNENISFLGDTLKVFYPKGSNAPSNLPRGGAGFVYTFPESYNRLSMSYTLKFEEGFDFVKGGKLPGLCGGNCSRGGSMPTASGFSIRFVWKKNGYLDIMTFFPNTIKAGNYSGEKMFKFEPGKEYLITQQLTLNDIGKENGIINILVDGVSVYRKDNFAIRITPDVQINSFLFSTFFGGKDSTYSSSKDTYIYFGKFKISEVF